jgi:hypothetical protein
MKSENCIEVKHVGNLSIAYLTRIFGSAGPIRKITKDDNAKYVTIVTAPPLRSSPTATASTRPTATTAES